MRNLKTSSYDPTDADSPGTFHGIRYTYWLNSKTHTLFHWNGEHWELEETNYGQEAHDQTPGPPET